MELELFYVVVGLSYFAKVGREWRETKQVDLCELFLALTYTSKGVVIAALPPGM